MATIVTFHAHPDDESIATGGTMARAAVAGHRVVLVLATRGECGEPVEGVLAEGELLGDRRAAEARTAADLLGVHRVEFLGYSDSGMMGTPTNDDPKCFWRADLDEAAARLARILTEVEADVLTIYDPHGGYGHPDHIQVHRVGTLAAELAGTDRVFWSTMNRDRIRRQLLDNPEFTEAVDEDRRERVEVDEFGMPEADITHAIDVRAVLGKKRDAIRAHASQISADMFFLSMPDDVFAEAFGTEWFIAAGQRRTGDFATDLFA
ncbi:MAG: PIG-L family deacetylase [Acidimicrobiales bacterium]|nr:PIG-L family deacetylase [Acidimicrobiales bacterium]